MPIAPVSDPIRTSESGSNVLVLLADAAAVITHSRRVLDDARRLGDHTRALTMRFYSKTYHVITGGSDATFAEAARKPARVLIADDNVDAAEMFAVYLGTLGYDVEIAENGRAAVEKAISLRPDVIVMDLEMPEVDGWNAIKTLRADERTANIPVIVLTGHYLGRRLEPIARSAGARSFLTKPCDATRLAREVSRCLNERRPIHSIAGASESALADEICYLCRRPLNDGRPPEGVTQPALYVHPDCLKRNVGDAAG